MTKIWSFLTITGKLRVRGRVFLEEFQEMRHFLQKTTPTLSKFTGFYQNIYFLTFWREASLRVSLASLFLNNQQIGHPVSTG